MDNNLSFLVHRTVACRAETENLNPYAQIWEFTCPYCDYRATYERIGSRLGRLSVWNEGDPTIRHHNRYDSEIKEETWLTPQVRQQMELLLADINLE